MESVQGFWLGGGRRRHGGAGVHARCCFDIAHVKSTRFAANDTRDTTTMASKNRPEQPGYYQQA